MEPFPVISFFFNLCPGVGRVQLDKSKSDCCRHLNNKTLMSCLHFDFTILCQNEDLPHTKNLTLFPTLNCKYPLSQGLRRTGTTIAFGFNRRGPFTPR